MKNRLLAIAAAAEALTGLVLIVYPPLVIKLLFAAEIAGVGVVISRFAGLALVALGVACWPYGSTSRAVCGMLTYSTLATLGLFYIALGGEWNGPLLWPAVALRAVLTLFLAWAWFKAREDKPNYVLCRPKPLLFFLNERSARAWIQYFEIEIALSYGPKVPYTNHRLHGRLRASKIKNKPPQDR